MRIEQFHPEHLRGLEPHRDSDRALLAPVLANPQYGEALAAAGPCFTGFVDDRAIGCAGVICLDENRDRGHVWALMTAQTGPHMLAITRAIWGFLRTTAIRRLETQVFIDWPPGPRWVEMLGFEREGLMRRYTPDNRDAWLYAKVRD